MAQDAPIDMLNQGSGMHSEQAPDIYGAICGWRAFECGMSQNHDMRLVSPHYQEHIWRRGEQPPSICLAKACEGENCLCGYNAFTTRDMMDRSLDHDRCPVIGEIEMWGRVREFDLGWRAENVQIKRLIVREMEAIRKGMNPHKLARQLSETYGVPVEIDHRLFRRPVVEMNSLPVPLLIALFIAAMIITFIVTNSMS